MSDLVNVVRCKDCQYSGKSYDPFEQREVTYCDVGLMRYAVRPDHFCGYGDRKDASKQ